MYIDDSTMEKFVKNISSNKKLEFFDIPHDFKNMVRKTEGYTENPLNPNISSILSSFNYIYIPSVSCDKYFLKTLDPKFMEILMHMEGIKEFKPCQDYNLEYDKNIALEDFLISLEYKTLDGVIKIRNDAKVDFLIFDKKMGMKAAIDLSFVTKLVIIDALGKSNDGPKYEYVRDHSSFYPEKEEKSITYDPSKLMEEIEKTMNDDNNRRPSWEEEDEEVLKPEKKKKKDWEIEY